VSDFKAEMHQIRFPLGLLPRPDTAVPQTSLLYLRGPVLRGGRRKGREKKGRETRKQRGEEEKRVVPPIGDSGSGSGLGEGRENANERSLGWVVQALLFPLLFMYS